MLSSPLQVVRSGAEAMAELQEVLGEMAKREADLRGQLRRKQPPSPSDRATAASPADEAAASHSSPRVDSGDGANDAVAVDEASREDRSSGDASLSALRTQHANELADVSRSTACVFVAPGDREPPHGPH